MLEELLKKKVFPSPLIIESMSAKSVIERIVLHVLCETKSGCENCRSCRLVLKGSHPDYISVEGGAKIDEVREKLRHLHQKPFQSLFRVMVFFDLQNANSFVQNALLKTFEEPRENWIILAGVNSRLGLLTTIRSRCLLYKILDHPTENSLSEDEDKVFRFVENTQDLQLQQILESFLKERSKIKLSFLKLLHEASARHYPGHWIHFAPELENSIAGLQRNLNPRILWDSAWSRSFLAEF